jgi:hypothetical protein
MRSALRSTSTRVLLTALVLMVAAAPLFANSTINIVNINAPGVGFNDPTPRPPIGGNPGTTLGQQRMIAFQYAASIWSALLDSAVPINIEARMIPLACSPTAGTLGSTGALGFWANFPGAPQANTWYHVALANRLTFADLQPGAAGDPSADDMITNFNSSIGTNPNCLTGLDWYYGLDDNHGANFDLVTVLLHEFAHGLGFSPTINKTTGALLGPPFFPDTYTRFMFDNPLGLGFAAMTDAQRAASTKDTLHVVWTGANVTSKVPTTLQLGAPVLTVNSPASVAGVYAVGTAQFGPALAAPGITGGLVLVDDGVAPATDACQPIVNGAALAGKVALLDRGTCTFVVKAKNAQNAGATAVVVADNVAGSPPAGLAGVDPTITIPTVRISLADGSALKAALGSGVNVTVGLNPTLRAGADPAGRALLYTPVPVAGGSSLSHWDVSATPNLLMEPAINSDLTHNVDLTLPLLRDIGWAPDADLDGVTDDQDQCLHSDLRATVVVGTCDSGVGNTLFTTGCTIADEVAGCAVGAKNHGAFVSCVAHLTNDLKKSGIISGSQKGAIQSCAGGSGIP